MHIHTYIHHMYVYKYMHTYQGKKIKVKLKQTNSGLIATRPTSVHSLPAKYPISLDT